MEKKRSIGVTLFGILFIIGGLHGTIRGLNMKDWFTFYSLISSIFLLILGVNILRLKEWARKGIIYYLVITTLLGIFLLPAIFKRQIKLTDIPLAQSDISFIAIFSVAMWTIVAIIEIFFFTRPKVKEQFTS